MIKYAYAAIDVRKMVFPSEEDWEAVRQKSSPENGEI